MPVPYKAAISSKLKRCSVNSTRFFDFADLSRASAALRGTVLFLTRIPVEFTYVNQ
jgi:hypothetical protein